MKVTLIKTNKNEIEVLRDKEFNTNSDAVKEFKRLKTALENQGFRKTKSESHNGRRHLYMRFRLKTIILSMY